MFRWLVSIIVVFLVFGGAVQAAPETEDEEEDDAAESAEVTTATTAVEATAVSTEERIPLKLDEVLALTMRYGREARQAEQELARAYQQLNFVKADYRFNGVASLVTNDDRDDTSVILARKINQ